VLLRSTRREAVLAVGLQAEALPQRFLPATIAGKVFPQPVNIRVHLRPSAVKISVVISVHQWLKML
jgi:hypothetical protein